MVHLSHRVLIPLYWYPHTFVPCRTHILHLSRSTSGFSNQPSFLLLQMKRRIQVTTARQEEAKSARFLLVSRCRSAPLFESGSTNRLSHCGCDAAYWLHSQ